MSRRFSSPLLNLVSAPVDGGPSHAHHRGNLVNRHCSGLVQPPHLFDLLLIEFGGTTPFPAADARGLESGAGAFADQVAFELSQAAEDVEHERASGRARVDRFGQGAELHSPLVERGHQVDQVLHAPAETVQLPHHDRVSPAQQVEHVVEFGTVRLRVGRHVGEDPIAAGPHGCVLLQVGGLVAGADPRVSVNHARHVPLPILSMEFWNIDYGTGFGTLSAGVPWHGGRSAFRTGNVRFRYVTQMSARVLFL